MSQNAGLPQFDNPPVIEVALSVAFESLQGFTSGYAGRLWARYPEYPATEDQLEVDASIEESSAPLAPPLPKLTFEAPRIRTWFKSTDGTRLIQVQHNRFIYNWRRGATQQNYPSYEVVRKHFDETLSAFSGFLAEEGLGKIQPTQCEVTYVNHIEPKGSLGRVADVVSLWSNSRVGSFLPPLEDARFLARYVIPKADGAMLGRLNVSLQPAYVVKTGAEILTLNMMARGKPLSSDIEGAFGFLDIGHEWIVRGFAELTTPEMHSSWVRLR